MWRAESGGASQRSLMVLFGWALGLAIGSTLPARSDQERGLAGSMQIHAGADWYRARPEPEERRRGVLRARDVPVGPGARVALRYALVTNGESLAVYAPQPSQELASLVGQPVLVYGKVVDMANEGFGKELWIGSIAASPP